jgi:SAM-dependent methyltransferase
VNPGEHELMARAEEGHWWYRGLRDLLARCLAQPDLGLPARPRVLDAGCGTGANLCFLGELLSPAWLGGFDTSEEALALARRKVHGAEIRIGDICDPPLPAEPLDLVVSLDVICIPGADAAFAGLRRIAESLAPGGLLILNLPALPWLRAEHDVAVHIRERFTTCSVRSLLDRLGLAPLRLSYRLAPHLPLVVLSRLPGMLRVRRGATDVRSDLHHQPGRLESAALLAPLRLENALVARGVRMPWGSSVFAVGRRPR